jgi:hypothetical protein
MEEQILELIEEEVNRRVALRLNKSLEVISKMYEIPLEQLTRDVSGIETRFCQGTLKNKKRCLKEPQANGYCKFHQNQIPVLKAQTVATSNTPVVWTASAPNTGLNI